MNISFLKNDNSIFKIKIVKDILIVSVVKILGTEEGESVFAKFTIIIVNACYGILNI